MSENIQMAKRVAETVQTDYPDKRDILGDGLQERVETMLLDLNLETKLKLLKGENTELVVRAIGDILIIDSLGREIEETDKEWDKKIVSVGLPISLYSDTKGPLGIKIEEIGIRFHGKPDWVGESVTDVINAATNPISDERDVSKGKAAAKPAQYIGSLSMATQAYDGLRKLNGWDYHGNDAEGYINGDRQSTLRTMSETLDYGLSRNISSLKNPDQEG